MKYFLHCIAILLLSAARPVGVVASDFFQLPIVPDSLTTLTQRSDYMLSHYWDFCDLKKAFSSRDKMADAFDTFISFMPYATPEVSLQSVDNFMKRISKQPSDMLYIGQLAESALRSDSAKYEADNVYLHFIDPIIANKKVDKTSKLRYQHQSRILHNTLLGAQAPEFNYMSLPDSIQQTFRPDSTKFATVIMFSDPDCDDCNFAKLRLDADIQTSRLIEAGRVQIVVMAVNAGDFTIPEGWIGGFAPDVDEIYDITTTPSFYIIDSSGRILGKNSTVEQILSVMSLIRVPRRKSAPVSSVSQPVINEIEQSQNND